VKIRIGKGAMATAQVVLPLDEDALQPATAATLGFETYF
jgi:hypothetical protein